MGLIQIENMEFYANHGCYDRERLIGNRFLVNLDIVTKLDLAAATDNLKDTLDYQAAYDIVREEMNISSSLLEHVAGRILDKLYEKFPGIEKATVKVSKMNPPMGGQMERVSVTMNR